MRIKIKIEMSSSKYKELKVWEKSMDLISDVYTLVKSLPKEEMYGLSDQMRRAAVSIPSNIAEGHGRHTDKEFIKFLSISRGSLFELETQLEICRRLNYMDMVCLTPVMNKITEISKMLNSLISYRKNNEEKDLSPKA